VTRPTMLLLLMLIILKPATNSLSLRRRSTDSKKWTRSKRHWPVLNKCSPRWHGALSTFCLSKAGMQRKKSRSREVRRTVLTSLMLKWLHYKTKKTRFNILKRMKQRVKTQVSNKPRATRVPSSTSTNSASFPTN
jgi:hypothetical protein